MLFYLIYISKAQGLDQNDLRNVLQESIDWNKEHGITGMLLYVPGYFSNPGAARFIQVLEGTEFEVKLIFEKIKQDSRHHNVLVVNEGSIKKRHFSKWEMGFETLEMEEYRNMPSYFELEESFVKNDGQQKLNVPLTFLKTFYSMSLHQKVKF